MTDRYVKVAAVAKHFVAYSLEEADGEMRFYFDAKVTQQDLEDTYDHFVLRCIRGHVRPLCVVLYCSAFRVSSH